MSEKPERWSFEELAAAGWREEDIRWEVAAEVAMQRLADGDAEGLRKAFTRMVAVSNATFSADDPRIGTSLANYGAAIVAQGEGRRAGRTIADARAIWRGAESWVAKMTAPRVAKSSLFHMRMEQRHRPTYEARWRAKWDELVEEARARMAPEPLRLLPPEAARERLARWKRERPAMLNDTRKLMAAVMLLACSDERDAGD